jgi:hypothetical protein
MHIFAAFTVITGNGDLYSEVKHFGGGHTMIYNIQSIHYQQLLYFVVISPS